MCGIAGIAAFTSSGQDYIPLIEQVTQTLRRRGPDNQSVFIHDQLAFGHTRLSVIDTAETAHQPQFDQSGNYAIIFNGEIFNYQSLKAELTAEGVEFRTHSDTEVLLYTYIRWGISALKKLNGFFAFAIYHLPSKTLFLARDRFGIKPLLYFTDHDRFVFASEMKALFAAKIPRSIDTASLYAYLQLNYVPQPFSIFQKVQHLPPGECMTIQLQTAQIRQEAYYKIPYLLPENRPALPYPAAQQQLIALMDDAVQLRLISDVPLGAFLSGGIDSSVIVALASRHTKHLNTFSIGFKDEPLFDETKYARMVADKYQTNHTEFLLSTDDLYQHLFETLDYLDEPFADPSALAVNILSKHTRQKVTVSLSGDGADELFAGYHKHAAELQAKQWSRASGISRLLLPLFNKLPQSRNTYLGNFFRQINRFAKGLGLSEEQRYWIWASILTPEAARSLLANLPDEQSYLQRRTQWLNAIIQNTGADFNRILLTDMQLVLPGDMLRKVDSMSMAHGLEVRTPFLDYRVVNFAFSLPAEYKIIRGTKKRIVRDAFRTMLPAQLYNRPKQGFEIPLLRWLRTGLYSLLADDLLHPDFLHHQGIFNPLSTGKLLKQLQSSNPADSANTVWALLVFQYWWKRYMV
ncbi:MAG: asparagine synthase (glutamine-hydrolyzing) [Sphingobacteriales bacterium]|nr:MAG: asparagine synthase (glutamine-hydrolyzing) [Sphingobacteriales bacterium]